MNYDFMVLRYDIIHVNMNVVLSTEQDQVHLLHKVLVKDIVLGDYSSFMSGIGSRVQIDCHNRVMSIV